MSSSPSVSANMVSSKVSAGNAPRAATYRDQDPSAQMCPVWNGQDNTGRQSCEYSFYTKTPGCNSAGDRITVENGNRPIYASNVSLDAGGIIARGLYDSVNIKQDPRRQFQNKNGFFGTDNQSKNKQTNQTADTRGLNYSRGPKQTMSKYSTLSEMGVGFTVM